MGQGAPFELEYLRLKLLALEAAIADAECFDDLYPEWQLVLLRERRAALIAALEQMHNG